MASKYNTDNLLKVGGGDLLLELSKGNILGHTVINKFGRNSDVDTASLPEDVWSAGGINTQPTEDRIHAIESNSLEDAGTLVSSGSTTSATSSTALIDSSATFIADGVAANDIILLDDSQDHSVVESVVSETQLKIHTIHHTDRIASGEAYRVVTSAGTGAAVAHIKLGYQLDGTAITEFIILNGTTLVNTVNEFFRINRIHIHGVGSNRTNVGTISATAATDATISAVVSPNMGQTLMAVFHIPQGSTGYMTRYYGTIYRTAKAADAQAQIRLKSRLWGSHDDGDVVEHLTAVSISGAEHVFNPPKRLSQGTDIWIDVDAVTDDNMSVSAGFDVILIKN